MSDPPVLPHRNESPQLNIAQIRQVPEFGQSVITGHRHHITIPPPPPPPTPEMKGGRQTSSCVCLTGVAALFMIIALLLVVIILLLIRCGWNPQRVLDGNVSLTASVTTKHVEIYDTQTTTAMSHLPRTTTGVIDFTENHDQNESTYQTEMEIGTSSMLPSSSSTTTTTEITITIEAETQDYQPHTHHENNHEECVTPTCRAIEMLKSSLDESFHPCEDFYQFACGGWIRQVKDQLQKENATATSFLNEIDKENTKFVQKLIERIQHSESGATGKVARFYTSCTSHPNLKAVVDTFSPSRDTGLNSAISEVLAHFLLQQRLPFLSEELKRLLLLSGNETGYNAEMCTYLTRLHFPEVVAKLYVQNYFEHSLEEGVLNLANKVWKTFNSQVSYHTDWITDLRSTVTLKKNLDQLVIYVGYMGHILDDTLVNNRYEELTISTNSSDFISNWKQLAVLYEERKNFMELELDLNTPLANAFYYPDVDKVFIPAGIVQMPEFHPDFPDVLKFAKLGATIGHELGHALHFYVNGVTSEYNDRLYEVFPSVVSQKCRDNYEEICACVADQYETYEVQLPAGYENETLTVNGTLTSEENVADNIGLQVAFTSFLQNEADKLWEPLEGLEMFSREQIFFIAHAQESCEAYASPDVTVVRMKKGLEKDSHSPGQIRVLGSLSNSPDFSKAWECPVGSKYNPDRRCKFFS